MTFGQETVYRVHKTPNGCKVTCYDGHGLADGIFTKRYTRYFYGENAEEKATEYAHNKHESVDETSRVVELGERV